MSSADLMAREAVRETVKRGGGEGSCLHLSENNAVQRHSVPLQPCRVDWKPGSKQSTTDNSLDKKGSVGQNPIFEGRPLCGRRPSGKSRIRDPDLPQEHRHPFGQLFSFDTSHGHCEVKGIA